MGNFLKKRSRAKIAPAEIRGIGDEIY